jgi:hypothetical protein
VIDMRGWQLVLIALLVGHFDPFLGNAASQDTAPRTIESAFAEPATLPEGVEKARQAVVKITFGDKTGAGFIISPEGHVLTALHVIEGSVQGRRTVPHEIVIELDDSITPPSARAKFEGADALFDLAILRILDPPSRFSYRLKDEVSQGLPWAEMVNLRGGLETPAELYVSGHSARCLEEFSNRECTFRTVRTSVRSIGELGYIQLSDTVDSGFSGGPAMGEDGKVHGFATSVNNRGGTRLVKFHHLQSALWRMGINAAGWSRGYRDYPRQIELLTNEYEKMKSALESMRKVIDWQATVTEVPVERGANATVNEDAIRISWSKLFGQQYTPESIEELCITVYPTQEWSQRNREFMADITPQRPLTTDAGQMKCAELFSAPAEAKTPAELTPSALHGHDLASTELLLQGDFYVVDYEDIFALVRHALRMRAVERGQELPLEDEDIDSLLVAFVPVAAQDGVSLPSRTLRVPMPRLSR